MAHSSSSSFSSSSRAFRACSAFLASSSSSETPRLTNHHAQSFSGGVIEDRSCRSLAVRRNYSSQAWQPYLNFLNLRRRYHQLGPLPRGNSRAASELSNVTCEVFFLLIGSNLQSSPSRKIYDEGTTTQTNAENGPERAYDTYLRCARPVPPGEGWS